MTQLQVPVWMVAMLLLLVPTTTATTAIFIIVICTTTSEIVQSNSQVKKGQYPEVIANKQEANVKDSGATYTRIRQYDN